jgi:hypothetical protein
MDAEEQLLSEGIEATDKELFDSAMAPEPPGDEPEPVKAEPEAKPDADEPARDEQGRFVANDKDAEPKPEEVKPEQPKPEPTAEADDKSGQVPSWRLREEREAKAELAKQLDTEKAERTRIASEMAQMRAQLAQLQKPAETKPEDEPDPLLDPKGFRDHLERKFSERLLNQQRDMDMRLAHRQHGKLFEDAYNEASQALAQGDVQLRAMMNETASPGEMLVNWYRQRQTLREVGNDPAAYKTKLLEEALKDPAYLAKAIEAARVSAGGAPSVKPAGNSRPPVDLPPSLTGAARADAIVPDDHDASDEALFKYAMRS